jgi:RNA polymerase sigma factor (sigma-70 family)
MLTQRTMAELRTLVADAQQGDLAACAEIVRRFQAMAYGYARALLGDFHLAEDAAQEAFIEGFMCLTSLREPDAFPGWLRRIVLKHCDRLTRRKRVATAPLEAAGGVACDRPGPPEAAERREMREDVLGAVQALPDNERVVTMLFYIDGYSQRDIAGFLEVPVSTVSSRLHTARRRLRERMTAMVRESLESHGPDERFSRMVIDELLSRPRLLDVEGHPVRQVWQAIRAALHDYEEVHGEEEVPLDDVLSTGGGAGRLYRTPDGTALRNETTVAILQALRDRTPPVRLVTAGRVFRADREDATHRKMFHQMDAAEVGAGAGEDRMRECAAKVLEAALGPRELQWKDAEFHVTSKAWCASIVHAGRPLEVLGCGLLKPEVLARAGCDPGSVEGYALGAGLERLAMIRTGTDDIRSLQSGPRASA